MIRHQAVMEALQHDEAETRELGPHANLAHLIRQHQRMVWRYLRMLGAPTEDADDLLQETFLRLAAYLEAHGDVRVPEAFLRSVARNLYLAQRRAERRRAPRVEWTEAVDAMLARDPEAFADQRIEALQECQSKLNGRAAQAVQLHYLDGRPYLEVAKQLEISPHGLRSLLQRTRQLLRECVRRIAATNGELSAWETEDHNQNERGPRR